MPLSTSRTAYKIQSPIPSSQDHLSTYILAEGSIHSFFGGFDIYASEPLTPSCFQFNQ
jgi:hypothetical protein